MNWDIKIVFVYLCKKCNFWIYFFQILQFIFSHGEIFHNILRDRQPPQNLQALKELSLTTAVIARAQSRGRNLYYCLNNYKTRWYRGSFDIPVNPPPFRGSLPRKNLISRMDWVSCAGDINLPNTPFPPPNKKIKYNKILTYILRSIFLEISPFGTRVLMKNVERYEFEW